MSNAAVVTGRRSALKCVVVGDSAVGKTSLLQRFVANKFDPRFKATCGSDFLSKEVTLDGEPVQLNLWDTAGQERFQSLGTGYLRGSDAGVLVFDVTSQDSFEHLSSWLEEFVGQCGKKPIMLIANKCDNDLDISRRAITAATAKRWCQVNGDIIYAEASARDDTGVTEAFEQIAQIAHRQRKAQADDMQLPDPKRVKNIGAVQPQKDNKGCPC